MKGSGAGWRRGRRHTPGSARTQPGPWVATTRWHILVAAISAQIGISIVDQGLPTLTGFIKEDLGISALRAGFVPSAFIFGRAVGSYMAGLAADRFGERTVLLGGATIGGLCTCAAAGAPFAALLILLALAGAGSAAGTPAGGRMIMLAFAPERRGLALGLRQAAVPAGGLLGAMLLPWFASTWSWRWSLLPAGVCAILGLVPLLVWRTAAPPPLKRSEHPPYGIARVSRDRNILLLTIWGCLFVCGQYALLVFLALDFHQRFGFGLAAASLFVVIAQASGIIARVGWGVLSDRALRWGRKPLIVILTVDGLIGAACLYAVPRSVPAFALIVIVAIAGAGCIGFPGLLITMVAEAAGPQRVGAATGYASTFLLLAAVVTPPLFGLLADTTGAYRSVWGALTILLAVALVPAVMVSERRVEPPHPRLPV